MCCIQGESALAGVRRSVKRPPRSLRGRRFLTLYILSLLINPNTGPFLLVPEWVCVLLCDGIESADSFWIRREWKNRGKKKKKPPCILLAGGFFFIYLFFCHIGARLESASHAGKRQLNSTALHLANSWASFQDFWTVSPSLLRPTINIWSRSRSCFPVLTGNSCPEMCHFLKLGWQLLPIFDFLSV